MFLMQLGCLIASEDTSVSICKDTIFFWLDNYFFNHMDWLQGWNCTGGISREFNPNRSIDRLFNFILLSKVWKVWLVFDLTIKRRHLFVRYSIVFPSFSVSEREKWGKHIEKRYDKERRNSEPGRHTDVHWGKYATLFGTLRNVSVILHRINCKFRAMWQTSHWNRRQ